MADVRDANRENKCCSFHLTQYSYLSTIQTYYCIFFLPSSQHQSVLPYTLNLTILYTGIIHNIVFYLLSVLTIFFSISSLLYRQHTVFRYAQLFVYITSLFSSFHFSPSYTAFCLCTRHYIVYIFSVCFPAR